MTQYYQLICQKGHQISFWYKLNDGPKQYCERCGESTISCCKSCGFPIYGYEYPEGVITMGPDTYPVPSYCRNCSHPYPWTELILNNAVELISLDDNLPEDVREIIKNALPDLIVESTSTPLAAAKYKKFIPEAAKYVQDGLKNLLVDVTSEVVKKTLWG
ncbi:DUF2321 domain-containing protein [Lysinibacillus sphaericus]|uniref:DUF2321 domain-containing protein n=1 Tax=Lysinibacillus sphaericus TaxID=1421 RepID=UPI000C1865BB|nr:DUF2321 domain-containing protein [Lysinibacillus sphaericus]PIJ97888.1 hypothetical protein CTN02_11345 [Lysinibacillus sphaericus]